VKHVTEDSNTTPTAERISARLSREIFFGPRIQRKAPSSEQLGSRCDLQPQRTAANSLTRDFREAEANLLILFIKFLL
jgi:hypothetical protein